MGTASSSTWHEELVAKLRLMIMEGELPPGVKIPEKELCIRFEVSRTPLREALKVLAAEGHVELQPNRGARVTRLTTRDVVELFQVSEALEALAGELATKRIEQPEIDAIARLHSDMVREHADGNLPNYYRLNRKIHEAIVRASGSAVLISLYEQVSMRIRRARFVAPMPQDRWDQAMSEHEGILNALLRRDGAVLSTILRHHLQNKSKQVVEAGFADISDE